MPLFLFEGISGKFITAALRPGKRPKGTENAIILKRVLKRLRAAWPKTHIVLLGNRHFSTPELMELALDDPYTDFIFGLTSNRVLATLAAPFLETNRRLHEIRCENAHKTNSVLPHATRTYHEVDYAAGSWPLFKRKPLVDALLDRLRHHCITAHIDGPSLRVPDQTADQPTQDLPS